MFKNLLRSTFGDQSAKKRPSPHPPPQPTHVKGIDKGEELARKMGKEPGRGGRGARPYRTARDATAIDPDARNPIHPDSPHIPPA